MSQTEPRYRLIAREVLFREYTAAMGSRIQAAIDATDPTLPLIIRNSAKYSKP